MKLFLDTNIWLRLLVADNKKQYQECLDLMKAIESGAIKPYTSTLVLMEVHYVLISFYNVEKKQAVLDIENLLETRNLTLIEKTDLQAALKLNKKINIKLTDCLIATQVPKSLSLCTYDKDFRKAKGCNAIGPGDVLSKR